METGWHFRARKERGCGVFLAGKEVREPASLEDEDQPHLRRNLPESRCSCTAFAAIISGIVVAIVKFAITTMLSSV